jgi:hypothetical protein
MSPRHALYRAAQLEELSRGDSKWLRTYLACSGATREWFGVPWWPEHVSVFVSQVADPDNRLHRLYKDRDAELPDPTLALAEIAGGLVTAPELLSVDVLAWSVDKACLGYVERQEVRRRWEAAGRPRWAPPPLPS